MKSEDKPPPTGLENSFRWPPSEGPRIETKYRRIKTALPVPQDVDQLRRAADLFPAVNCYQPPVIWERAEGYQVSDAAGNCWIDFSSTAVMTNSGHGHPKIREAIARYVEEGLLAQFSFHSAQRSELAAELLALAPKGMQKVYFWTTGSEAIESAFRVAREWGQGKDAAKIKLASLEQDYHGCTLAAHQLSGATAAKPWLPQVDQQVYRLPFLREELAEEEWSQSDWDRFVDEVTDAAGLKGEETAAILIETFQGWGALKLAVPYVQALRRWTSQHQALLIFDEVQTGFGRTGRWWGHEHYEVSPDMLCIGKGVTSSLPLAALLGPADVLDVFNPGEITTTHAAHPLSCVAALINLEVLREERLVERAAALGERLRKRLEELKEEWPAYIDFVSGAGLLWAIHLKDPLSGVPSEALARKLVWEVVRSGVMVFHTNRSTLKICPPLVIEEEALLEGVDAIGEALSRVDVAFTER